MVEREGPFTQQLNTWGFGNKFCSRECVLGKGFSCSACGLRGKIDLVHWGAVAGEYKLRTLFVHAVNVGAFRWIGLKHLGTERVARIDSLSYAGVAIRMGFLRVRGHSRSMFMMVFMVT